MLHSAWNDKIYRRLGIGAAAALIIGLLIDHASWLIGWQTAAGTMSVSQMNSLCTSAFGQAAQSIAGPTAQCNAAGAFSNFAGLLYLAVLGCACVAAYHAYQLRRKPKAGPEETFPAS